MEIKPPCNLPRESTSQTPTIAAMLLTTALFSQHTVTAVQALPLPTPTPVIGSQLRPRKTSISFKKSPSKPRMTLPGTVLACL